MKCLMLLCDPDFPKVSQTELSREEILEMFGGIALPITHTPQEKANIERYVAFVEREGYLP